MTTDLDALRTRLTQAGRRWKTARRDYTTRTTAARTQLAAIRNDHNQLVTELTALAHEATDAGISENETAALLGVSRARTLRRWLGK